MHDGRSLEEGVDWDSVRVPAPTRLLTERNFRWVLAGACIATLGSQLTGLALPWLVLEMTGDTLALGTVMALIGMPQALLLLFGGGLSDRFSPRYILVVAYLASAALLCTLAVLLYAGQLKLWMITTFAISTGIVFGLAVPASFSLVAASLPPELIARGTAVIGTVRQVLAFVGPLLAGALLGSGGEQPRAGTIGSYTPFALAFVADGIGLLVVAWCTARIILPQRAVAADEPKTARLSIVPAVRWFLRDAQVLTVIGYWSAVVFVFSGPLRVAIPLLAEQNSDLGAKAYGILVSANAGGIFLGMTLLSACRRFIDGRLWSWVIGCDIAAGLLAVAIALVPASPHQAVVFYATLLLFIGMRSGVVEIGWFSWLQARYPEDIRGRATSVFMVISTMNLSASIAVAGWLTRRLSASGLFLLAGEATVLMALLGALALRTRVLRVDA